MQRLEIKSTMTRVAMTLVMMLLTTMTAWAQDAIDGLTYNTSGGYYEIKDAQDLIDLANYVKGGGDTYGKTFKQTANITFEHTSDWNDTSSGERNFEGIGDFFKGDYYGQGFTISGLRMSYGHGIFYCAYGAIIDGIVLADSRITNNENVGGIVGYTYENIEKDSKPAIVNNCHVRSDVLIHNASGAKAFKIGGVVGHNAKYCQVTNCTSSATITGRTAGGSRESIGGIVGENRGTVSNNFAFDVTIGNIDSYYGAIVGENTYLAILSNNYYFNCTVSGRTSNIGCNGADVTTDNGAYNLSPAHFEQTGTNEYTIHSAVGWEVFCDMLANSDKGYFTGKTVKLGNDIQISRAAGLDQHDFTGTFDGQGNTIKLAFGTSQNRYTEHAAVFRNTEWASSEQYAKIQNLNVNGTIYTASNVIYDAGLVAKAFGGLEISNCTSDVIINTSNQFAGGFVGYNQGKLDIVNCRSNATIYSTVNGDGTHGGFVGNHHSDELTIEGCVFTGKLLTTATNSTAYCGGFVGWCNTATTIKNCLYAPAIIDTEHGETEVQVGTGDYTSCTFGRKSTATVTVTNSYYTRTLGTAQGKAARTVEAGDYVTIEAVSPIGSPVEDGTYSVSGITAYAKGITRGDAFYYGNGDEVSLTLNHAEPPAGYTFTGYSASAGTLDGTTLTMPGDGDVTINANYEFIKFTQGALSYECTSGTEVKVTACNTSATSVTIPATVTDNNVTYTVTAIAADAFSGCTALTTVIMEPTTPPTLGNDAFANCNELANIYVPAGTSGAYKTAWADYASKIEDYGACGTNVYWSYDSDNKTLTIFGTGAMADYSYSNRPWFSFRNDITTVDIRDGVTTIGNSAFEYCTDLKEITIPAGVTSIGDYAFSNCYSLSSIELPTSLTSICKGTFNTCTSLTSITIPAGVTSIGDQAFEWCTALTSIDLPASVTSIGYFAFSFCSSLSSIELPTSLTFIFEKVFEACTSLTSITIPASVMGICDNAFVKCSSLESISVAEGNTVYDSRNGCNAIIIKESNKLLLGCKNTVIPNSVTSIGGRAFYHCPALTSITIPASVTSIGEEAFESCNSLTTVIMQPTTPPTLGNDAFINCDALANIYVPTASLDDYKDVWADYATKIQGYDGACGTNVYWSYNSTSNTLTIFGTGDMTNDFEGNNWENYLKDITTVNISNGVTSIGDYAFSGCTGLTSIEIPASVTSIGDWAFQNCWGLTSIEIPASVTSIGYAAFITCIYLTSITIPASVTTIGDWAFANCTGLTSINIPASVTSIGDAAFLNCYGLESISVAEGNTVYDSRNGCNALIETASNTLIQGCKNTVIPNTVTSIGDNAFDGCEELKEITIPASVTSIGNYAFQECTSLTTVFMEPTTPPTLGNYVFNACDDLANIYVPAGTSGVYKTAWADYASKIEDYGSCGENVNWSYNSTNKTLTIFGTGAMADYSYSNRPWHSFRTNITTVDIRAGVTTIGNEAFQDCRCLTNIEIPASVTTIGDAAFQNCRDLSSIDLPASVTSIGDAAFNSCTALGSITVASGNTIYDSRNNCNALIETASNTLIQGCKNTVIPNTVTSIGDKAFDHCEELEEITIPASVTTIGGDAFAYCTSLTSIDIPASVTTIGDWAFNGCEGLTSITISEGVTSISQLAFDGCTSLTSITIPASVTSIGNYAFQECTSLTTVFMVSTTPPTLGYIVFYACDDLDAIYVPAGTSDAYKTAWADYASKIEDYGSCGENVNWSYNSDSHKLTIFGEGAMADYSYSNRPWFSFCNDITTVDIRNGVTTIGNEAFYSCNALTSIDIPASVTTIGNEAFYKCTSLTSLNIPASVTSIATNAFYECTGLESISVADGNTVYDSRNGCNALIETASNTLIQGCKNTVIPNTVTTIGDRAFFRCRMLCGIDIPASVTSIGDDAFYGCEELEVWLLRDEYPITQLGADVFDECDNLIIYVPTDKVTDYKAAWSDYADKIKGFGEMEVLGLNDHVDNSTHIALCNGVTLDVNLCGLPVYKDGDWNTLCLPFDLTIEGSDLDGNNVLAMTLDKETSGLSGTTLTLNFTKATTIPAGTPFIIKWDNMHVIYQLSKFTGVTIDNTDRSVTSSDGYVTFKGTYAPIVWETENNSILFLGTKNTLYWPQPSNNQTPYLNACRAYFQLNNGLTVENVSAARMNFDGENEVNGVKEVNATLGVNDDSWYTLNGVKLSGKPTKAGLYIHNGKKVIIK